MKLQVASAHSTIMYAYMSLTGQPAGVDVHKRTGDVLGAAVAAQQRAPLPTCRYSNCL